MKSVKRSIYDFICDDFYVPMKIKEIAMVLQITKEQRKELQEVLDSLVEEGKNFSFQAWKVQQGSDEKNHGNIPSEHPWIWICYGRG